MTTSVMTPFLMCSPPLFLSSSPSSSFAPFPHVPPSLLSFLDHQVQQVRGTVLRADGPSPVEIAFLPYRRDRDRRMEGDHRVLCWVHSEVLEVNTSTRLLGAKFHPLQGSIQVSPSPPSLPLWLSLHSRPRFPLCPCCEHRMFRIADPRSFIFFPSTGLSVYLVI